MAKEKKEKKKYSLKDRHTEVSERKHTYCIYLDRENMDKFDLYAQVLGQTRSQLLDMLIEQFLHGIEGEAAASMTRLSGIVGELSQIRKKYFE